MAAGPDGRVAVALLNNADAVPWGMVLRYEGDKFPYFFEWRYLDAGTYVLGLEPSTNGLTGRGGARESGELTFLQSGETRVYHVEIQIVEGQVESDRIRDEITQTRQDATP